MVNFGNDLKETNRLLGNHVHTLEIGYAELNKDMSWVKDGLMKHFARDEKPVKTTDDGKESKEDIKTQTDVDWLKRFFWVGITTVVTSLASLVITLLHAIFNKF